MCVRVGVVCDSNSISVVHFVCQYISVTLRLYFYCSILMIYDYQLVG